MITRNFKNFLKTILQSNNTALGITKVVNVTGDVRYLNSYMNSDNSYGGNPYPVARTLSYVANNGAGISFGKGTTSASEFDYNLEDQITSGISVSLISTRQKLDENRDPALEFCFTVTNTSDEQIEITEVGMKQLLRTSAYPLSTDIAQTACLLDRTILDSPLVIQPGDAGVLVYTLKSSRSQKQVNGVPIYDFSFGTDDQIATIIDAAREGTINLQTDAGWSVGDYRTIHVSEWTDADGVVHPAKDLKIVITSFEEYNECGNLFQFDFKDCDGVGIRYNSTWTQRYNQTLMYTTHLPLLVEALPLWLKTRLKTFSILVKESASSSNILIVEGNKLAIRSGDEIFSTYSNGDGTFIPYFNSDGRRSKNGARNDDYALLRTPASNGFVCIKSDGAIMSNTSFQDPSRAKHDFAPFGCV